MAVIYSVRIFPDTAATYIAASGFLYNYCSQLLPSIVTHCIVTHTQMLLCCYY